MIQKHKKEEDEEGKEGAEGEKVEDSANVDVKDDSEVHAVNQSVNQGIGAKVQ